MDIFSKDIILFPVNHSNSHWTAAAINFKKKRIESYDSMGMARDKVCMVRFQPVCWTCIRTNVIFVQYLRTYLDAEHQNKKKAPFDFTGWVNWDGNVSIGPSISLSRILTTSFLYFRQHLSKKMASIVVYSHAISWKLYQGTKKNLHLGNGICPT